jgi:hypothetical protein
MQAVGQDVHVGVSPWHQPAVVPDDAIDLVERNSHGLSPIGSVHFIAHARNFALRTQPNAHIKETLLVSAAE